MGLGIKTKIINFWKEDFILYFGPKTIRISPVNDKCTNSCPMCWRSKIVVNQKDKKQIKEFDLKKYKDILKSLPFTVSNIEVVGGGEPLLFPKIEELLKEIKNKKLIGSLITNGVMLTKKISTMIVSEKWDSVRISLNAGSEKIYSLTSGSNNFKKVIENIKNLINTRGGSQFPKINLHFVIQKSNFEDIDNFINLAEKIGVDSIIFSTLMFDSPNKVKLSKEESILTKNILRKSLKKIKIKNNIKEVLIDLSQGTNKREKTYFNDKYCQVVQTQLDINPRGIVVPCCMAYGETVAKKMDSKTIGKVWKEFSPFRKKLRKGIFEDFCYEKCNYDLKNR